MRNLLLSFILFAAGHTSLTMGATTSDKAIEISYTSFGTGVDFTHHKKFLLMLGDKVSKGEIKSYSVNHWGFEGESTSCIEFYSADKRNEMEESFRQLGRPSRGGINIVVKASCQMD